VEGELTSLKAYAHRVDASKESEIDQMIMTARAARAAVVQNQSTSDAEIISEHPRAAKESESSDRVVDLSPAEQANPAESVSVGIAPLLAAPTSETATASPSQTIAETVQETPNAQQPGLLLANTQDNTGDAATVGTETPRPDNGRKQRRGYGKKQNVDVEERLVDSVVPGAGETSGETVETPVETLNAVERELVGDRNAAKTSAVQAGATRFNIFESYLAPLQSGNRAQRALYWAMGGFVMPFVEEAAFRFGVFAEAGQALFGGTGFDLASVAGDTVLFGALFAGLHSVVEMSVIARQNGGGIKGWTSAISDRSVWSNFGQRLVFSGAMTAVYLASAAVLGPVAALGVSALAHGLFNLFVMICGVLVVVATLVSEIVSFIIVVVGIITSFSDF
jgi:hypothetical protein